MSYGKFVIKNFGETKIKTIVDVAKATRKQICCSHNGEKRKKRRKKTHTHTLASEWKPWIHEGSLNSRGDRILESIERNRHNLNFLGGYNMLNGKRNPRTAMKTPKNSNPR